MEYPIEPNQQTFEVNTSVELAKIVMLLTSQNERIIICLFSHKNKLKFRLMTIYSPSLQTMKKYKKTSKKIEMIHITQKHKKLIRI